MVARLPSEAVGIEVLLGKARHVPAPLGQLQGMRPGSVLLTEKGPGTGRTGGGEMPEGLCIGSTSSSIFSLAELITLEAAPRLSRIGAGGDSELAAFSLAELTTIEAPPRLSRIGAGGDSELEERAVVVSAAAVYTGALCLRTVRGAALRRPLEGTDAGEVRAPPCSAAAAMIELLPARCMLSSI